ncbi:MAG: hypothetical protein KDD67_06225 [Ignavibacteriae bacterium]|nr:hypothetical protein [Ignavibacteriota bacterium]MCB9215289.1 hypothetical protein [Ignavibacteria bacterium]
MKKTTIRIAVALLLGILTTLGLSAQERGRGDVPRIITYQGVLSSATGSPSGEYQITFRLYGDAEGREVIWEGTYATQIDRGLFSADLGSGAFPLPDASTMGRSLWLGVQVGENAEMNPRTLLSASPYALTIPDGSVTAEKIGTEYVSAITINGEKVTGRGTPFNLTGGNGIDLQYDPVTQGVQIGLSNQFVGSSGKKGNRTQTGDTNSGGVVIPWAENGNSGTTPGTHYVGTNDQVELEIHVNASNTSTTSGDRRVMLFDPQTNSPNLIGGFQGNVPGRGSAIEGATIGGGGQAGNPNRVLDNFGTIGGGDSNVAGGASTASTSDDSYATVGGGQFNRAQADHSTVGGGQSNQAIVNHSTVSGGQNNRTQANHATIGGGEDNTTNPTANHATIGGGDSNTVNFGAAISTIGGGQANTAEDSWGTIAGGRGNQTGHTGTFAGNTPIVSDYAAVAGGRGNFSEGSFASIGGGDSNYVSDDYGTIGGGQRNQAGNNFLGTQVPLGGMTDAQHATVGGGIDNAATGAESTIGGGNDNRAQALQSTVGGGFLNNVAAGQGTVGGGDNNNVFIQRGTIGGGQNNSVGVSNGSVGSHGTIGGGLGNFANGDFGTISGGEGHTIFDEHGTIGGGDSNSVGTNNGNATDASHATVGGGENNTASATHATVSGGEENSASAAHTTVGGGFSNSASLSFATVGGGNDNSASGTGSTVGGGNVNRASAHYATVAGGNNNYVEDDFGTIGGGSGNIVGRGGFTPRTDDDKYSTVSGGEQNQVAGPGSAIAGGRYLIVGENSFGFNGESDTSSPTQTDVSLYKQTAYFGNVDMWISNVDNKPRELRFFEANNGNYTYTGTSSTIPHYIALKAPASMTQDTNHADNGHTIYTLPGEYPSNDGELLASSANGTMSWTDLNDITWSLEGNANTSPGTGTGQHYLGTSDANALVLATNGTERVTIASNGAVTIANGLSVTGGLATTGSLSLGTGTPLYVAGDEGDADQVLTSNGANTTPEWKSISELAIPDAWIVGGNSGIGTGDFLGTSDASALSIATNSVERIGISSSGVTKVTGTLELNSSTTLKVNGSIGSPNQVLTSQGSGTPQWKTLSTLVGVWDDRGDNQTTEKLGVGIDTSDSPVVTLDVNGALAIQPADFGSAGKATVTVYNVTVGNRSYIRIASDGTPTNREVTLDSGLQAGQILIIECIGEDGNEYRGTKGFKVKSKNYIRLSGDANRDMQKFDMLTLIWDPNALWDNGDDDDNNSNTPPPVGRWIQLSFSGN